MTNICLISAFFILETPVALFAVNKHMCSSHTEKVDNNSYCPWTLTRVWRQAEIIWKSSQLHEQMFPKTWSETNNSLISDLIKNRSCFSDKEQEAQFIHSSDVCLSFLHPCNLESSGTQNVPTFFASYPWALLFIVDKLRLRKISWRQPEFWPLNSWALREFDSSSQSILDRLEVKRHERFRLTLNVPPRLTGIKALQTKQTTVREFQIVLFQCLELRCTEYVKNHDCWFKPTGLTFVL